MDYTTRTTCRICGSANLTQLFSLGEQYVSDFVRVDTPPGIKCPIRLELCNNCTLVQLKDTARQDFLYTKHYWYRSGATQMMRDALRDITRSAEELVDLQKDDIVLDIGSNDGTLLRSYTRGCKRVGVEPATNLAEIGKEGLDCFINDFWNFDTYKTAMWDIYAAKVITAIGMFYDLEDPNQFIADIAKALAPEGIFIAQLMTLRNMLAMNDVGNLAHEHLEFYSMRSLRYLMNKHGLEIFDVETNNTNGLSDRIYVCRKGDHGIGYRVLAKLDQEIGLSNARYYETIFKRWEDNKQKCVGLIRELVAGGMKVCVYGASTKGNTILQYFGLDRSLITYARDASPEKWGKYTVGTKIPIVSPEFTKGNEPDYYLVLPYAFLDEFIRDEAEWRANGGRFVVPLPEVKIV